MSSIKPGLRFNAGKQCDAVFLLTPEQLDVQCKCERARAVFVIIYVLCVLFMAMDVINGCHKVIVTDVK